MTRYKNLGGDSNVLAFETTEDGITVVFNGGSSYVYNNLSAGFATIQQMKLLAHQGKGLNSFINRKAKKLYAAKF